MRYPILLVLGSCALFERQETCDLGAIVADLTGPGAIDCGELENGDDATVWACAADALETGTAFFLTWEVHGIDSVIHHALTYDGGRMVQLSQDTYNGSDDVDGQICVDPFVAATTGTELPPGSIGCGSYEPEGTHYQVCGAICGPEACQPQPLPFPW